MLIPDFAVRLVRAFPDAAVLVSSVGEILAANAPARRALVNAAGAQALNLAEVVADSQKVLEMVRVFARTTELAPGAFSLSSGSTPGVWNCKGCAVLPADGMDPAVVLVRFWPRAQSNPFVLLSQKLTELNDEISRRQQVEEALRSSEAALRERAQEAEALNRAKDEFLATVSHELRTPLNAILGWSVMLMQGELPGHVQKGVEVIRRNAESQAKLIEDILDISRIISGNFRMRTRRADLQAIVQNAIEVVQPSAAAKRIEISFAAPASACWLVADPDRLQQVAWNLLSNAVKFTPRGGHVEVRMDCRGSQLVLSIADDGQGIDPAFLPMVFDRFRQADGSTTRRAGGLGLGLALVRHIVELHGGRATASSEGLGMGSTFQVTLPVAAVAPALGAEQGTDADGESQPELESALTASYSLAGIRVLVVDDERDARELVDTALSTAGAETATAASAAEALRLVAAFRPHVIVSDVGMPEEDGYMLMQAIRRLATADVSSIPAIALTAYSHVDHRAKALAAGFTTHFAKPVRPHELIAQVATLLGRSSQRS